MVRFFRPFVRGQCLMEVPGRRRGGAQNRPSLSRFALRHDPGSFEMPLRDALTDEEKKE